MIDGILILNKPKGISSGVFVRKLQSLFSKKKKIGHAGTLDPLACLLYTSPSPRDD